MINTPEMAWFSSNVLTFYNEEGQMFMNLALCHKVGADRVPVYVTLVTSIEAVPQRGETIAAEGQEVAEDALQADIAGQLFDCGSFSLALKVNGDGLAEGELLLTDQAGEGVDLDFTNVPALYLDVPGYEGLTMPDGNPQAPPPVSLKILS